ncbi:hypothetical protein [Nonomuraea dietziae]
MSATWANTTAKNAATSSCHQESPSARKAASPPAYRPPTTAALAT